MLEEKRALMSPVFVYRESLLFGGKGQYYMTLIFADL